MNISYNRLMIHLVFVTALLSLHVVKTNPFIFFVLFIEFCCIFVVLLLLLLLLMLETCVELFKRKSVTTK